MDNFSLRFQGREIRIGSAGVQIITEKGTSRTVVTTNAQNVDVQEVKSEEQHHQTQFNPNQNNRQTNRTGQLGVVQNNEDELLRSSRNPVFARDKQMPRQTGQYQQQQQQQQQQQRTEQAQRNIGSICSGNSMGVNIKDLRNLARQIVQNSNQNREQQQENKEERQECSGPKINSRNQPLLTAANPPRIPNQTQVQQVQMATSQLVNRNQNSSNSSNNNNNSESNSINSNNNNSSYSRNINNVRNIVSRMINQRHSIDTHQQENLSNQQQHLHPIQQAVDQDDNRQSSCRHQNQLQSFENASQLPGGSPHERNENYINNHSGEVNFYLAEETEEEEEEFSASVSDGYEEEEDEEYEDQEPSGEIEQIEFHNHNYNFYYNNSDEDQSEVSSQTSSSSSIGGLTQLEINSIPSMVYSAVQTRIPSMNKYSNQQTCSICLSSYQHKEVLRVLPCGHRFHTKCIDEWLSLKPFCALCRNNLFEQ